MPIDNNKPDTAKTQSAIDNDITNYIEKCFSNK